MCEFGNCFKMVSFSFSETSKIKCDSDQKDCGPSCKVAQDPHDLDHLREWPKALSLELLVFSYVYWSVVTKQITHLPKT